MADDIPAGVQVLFDQFETSDAASDDTTSNGSSPQNRDFHQELYPSYVPPHKRGHNVQEDKFVNFKAGKNAEADKVEGVDNDKYQRLKIPVPFALPRDKLARLKHDFPGVYFHCKDNGNHDHPFSHMVTMIGTRLMQRRMRVGSKILDVYGNPNACDRFNSSQMHAPEPKFMKALVNRVGPSDFIREVNKWGPFMDPDDGNERYHRGSLRSMINSGEIEQYDVLHLTHTLYYIPFQELADALHSPGKKKVAYALVHKHSKERGTINDGEQGYVKKWVGGVQLVKQTNLATKSTYVHPDLTSILFSQNKVWLPPSKLECRGHEQKSPTRGLAWEMHVVNEDTWIVELVPYVDVEVDGVVNYADMWDDDECLLDDDPLSTPSSSAETGIHQTSCGVMIPTQDGAFLELEIPCMALFNQLRMRCAGKERTAKLLEELISTANHLVNPAALFGNASGMHCPPDKIYDVAVAAFAVDIPKETMITQGIACLKPVLNDHARQMKLGPKYKDMSIRDIMTFLRVALQGARDVNKVVRSKDPVDLGLGFVQGYVD